ncbi:MAG: hypothetical protein PSV16_09325 [Flavobacterium sp.]|nr:hypothetical protein [Flavobacterium sp.]
MEQPKKNIKESKIASVPAPSPAFFTKEGLDKFSVLATTAIAIFTAFTAFNTNKLSGKVQSLKATQEEGTAVSALIKELSSDNISTVKYDYAFLSLERYLRNTDEDGNLKPQDKNMMVGFAQSLIYDRINNNMDTSVNVINRILIPKQFLEKNDSLVLQDIQLELSKKFKKAVTPFNASNLIATEPIFQTTDTEKSKSISLILSKIAYIQYADKSKRETAVETQQKLKGQSWVAPGVEKVTGNYDNTIRYFHDEDQYLANQANETLDVKYKLLRVYNFEAKVPKGQIEVWIGN